MFIPVSIDDARCPMAGLETRYAALLIAGNNHSLQSMFFLKALHYLNSICGIQLKLEF